MTIVGTGLEHGDGSSHVTARSIDLPLLYVGNAFSQTDVRSALA